MTKKCDMDSGAYSNAVDELFEKSSRDWRDEDTPLSPEDAKRVEDIANMVEQSITVILDDLCNRAYEQAKLDLEDDALKYQTVGQYGEVIDFTKPTD